MWPWLIVLLNLYRKLFDCLSKMRNHCISMEMNSRVIVTQTVKIWKKDHLCQEILTWIKPFKHVASCPNPEQGSSHIALLESTPFKYTLFPILRQRAWVRWRRKPRLLLRWDGAGWSTPKLLSTQPPSSCSIPVLPSFPPFPSLFFAPYAANKSQRTKGMILAGWRGSWTRKLFTFKLLLILPSILLF